MLKEIINWVNPLLQELTYRVVYKKHIYYYHRRILLFLSLLSTSILSAQSITPFTINIAGFTATQNGYSLTVSTGETISITDFKSPNGLGLSSGFLQNNPSLVTGIEDVLPRISDNEVSVSPNPTITNTYLTTSFAVPGQMQFQILDLNSKILFRSEAQNAITVKRAEVVLSNYPAGVYYILVFFKPIIGSPKSGIYKIIKL
jgi:hypothetical protein